MILAARVVSVTRLNPPCSNIRMKYSTNSTIFDKLSKMVASTLRKFVDMIRSVVIWSLKLNDSFDKIRVEVLERKVINIMDLLAEKTLSVTLNDINSRNEVRASVLLE